jgi:hypothetical protein
MPQDTTLRKHFSYINYHHNFPFQPRFFYALTGWKSVVSKKKKAFTRNYCVYYYVLCGKYIRRFQCKVGRQDALKPTLWIFGPERKQGNGENYIPRNFIIFTLHQI